MNGNILNNIYDKLSQDNLVDVDFDAWQSNFVQDPEVVGNVYNYLSQQGLVTAGPEEWVKNINEELAAQQPKVEEKPKTEDEIREIVSESLPTASAKAAKYLDNVGHAVKSLFTDKEERQETKEVLGAVGSELKRRPINILFNKLPATFAQFYKSIGFDDLYDSEELEYLKTQDPNAVYVDPMGDPTGFKTNADRIKYLEGYESSSAGLAEKEIENFIVEKMKVAEISDKYLRKDTGEGIVKGIKQGDASDIIGGIFNAGASMVETVVPAMLTGGMSIPFQITAPMITEYNQRKAETIYGKDDPDAVRKLFENDQQELLTPAALGVVASTAEYVGFKGVSNYLLGKAATSNAGKLILTGNKEGLTELFQSGIDEVNIASAEGKDGLDLAKAWIDGVWSEKGLESYLQGFIGGTSMSAGGRAINMALRSDNASIKEVNDKINFIADLNFAKNQTKDIDIKEAINLEIKEAEQGLKDYINEKRKLNKVLTTEEKTSLIDILNEKDGVKEKVQSLRAKLENGTINRKEFGYAIRSLNNQDKKLSDQLSGIQTSATTRAADVVTETVKEQIKEAGLEGKVTEMTSEDISNIKDEGFDSKTAAKEFGFIKQFADGSFEIILNKDKPMIGTAAHEFMHAVLFKTIGANKNIQDALGDALVEHTSDLGGETSILGERLSAYGEFQEDGTFVRADNFGEETITIMSESIIDGSLKFNENFFTKIGDIVRRFSQNYLGKKITFNTGRDVYNFVKDYSKSIKDGKINKAILKVAKEGAKGKLVEGKAKPEATVQMSKVYQEVEAMKSDLTSTDPAAKRNAALIAANTLENEVDRRLPKLENVSKEAREDIVRNFLFSEGRGLTGLLAKYDPDVNDSVMGYLNSFVPGTKISLLDARLQEFYKDDPRFGNIVQSMEQEGVTEKVERQAAEEVTTKTKPKPTVVKEKILLETFEESQLQDEIRQDVVDIGIEGVEKYLDFKKETVKHRKFMKDGTEITSELKAKYKDQDKKPPKELKSKRIPTGKFYPILEKVAAKYGITDPIRLIQEKDLDTKQRKKAQDYILSKRDEHIVSIPEGTTKAGDPTGIANTAIGKAFFKAGGRTKFKTTGTGKGLKEQAKQRIEPMAYLEIFGLIPGNRINNPSVDPAIRSQIIQTAITATRQAAQQEKDALKLSKKSIDKLKDGKSSIMYSKDIAENVKNDKKGNFTKRSGLVGPNGKPIKTIPKDKVYIEKEDTKTGLMVGDVVSIKQMEALWDTNRGITWQDHMSNRLNAFLDKNPKYYNAVQELFTGGVKRTAYMTKDIFEAAVPRTKKINETQQVNADRLNYTKGKKVRSNIESLNLSIEKNKGKNFINFFNDIGAYLNDGQNMLDLWLMEELLLHSSVDQNNFFRKSAPLIGYPVDDNGNIITNEEVVEEHTPINEVIKVALGASIRNNMKDVTPLLESMTSQLAILEADDPSGSLKSSMGIDFYNNVAPRILDGSLKLKPGHAGIYRLMKHGVNPFRYKLLESGKTIAQEFGVDGMTVEAARENIIKYFEGEVSLEYNIQMSKVSFSKDVNNHNKLNEAINNSRTTTETKGITVLDFDDTLATTKSLVKYTTPDGKTGTLNAEQYASTYEDLLDQGFTFDFSDFNKVVKGKLAPLFQKALKLQGKFGPKNMFVLTARPPAAQKAIFDFLKANGLNIPLKNITGLANSTSEAKALWIADKVGEGYNDFYFADDALQNVQAVKNMLDQFDVKSKVQQAKVKFSKDMNTDFNNILEEVTGIEAKKRFSETKARKRGESKGKFRFFIPPSHEDFVGLLYNFMGKGRKGDGHRDFFEQALVRPLNRAYREIDTAKQAIANDYKSLNKQFPNVKDKLIKNTPDGDFTFQDAIRVYLWNKHGYTIPGLSATDQTQLSELVMSDPSLQAYAETLNVISKQDTYVDPGPNWETGNIRIDLVDATGRVGRASYFTEFNENAEIIFSLENLNKIEAAYGKGVREALEDMLHRIKTGINRPKGASAKPNMFMNWLNASVSGVMFFNTRSALLQQMSNVNYLNFADNNIYAAGKAFANQPQYWKDFAMIFNSDMLKQRRGGLQTDINGAELAEAIKKARPGNLFDQVAIITGKALRLGFLPTQIGDNIAIATGGATFYRNRVNKYIKDGLTVENAEKAAFTDFQNITQATQQSARPDMTSAQQASWVGKLILNFLNTPSQYNRIIKKAGSDIINRRITKPNTTRLQSDMSNMSRILYYGAAQNLIFYGLQTALFAVMFGLEGDDEEKRAEQVLKKKERVINGAIDTILRGSGIYGVAVSTIKNMVIKFLEQREKGYNKDESAVIMELANFSPVVGIKLRKIVNAEKTLNYNKNIIDEMETFDIDNPQWSAVTNYVEAITTAPANRVYQKTINLRNATDNQYTAFQRAMFFSGYTTWSLNLGDTQKMKEIKESVKEKKKVANREKAKIKREEKKKEKEKENKSLIEENKKKKDGRCAHINTSGNRCKNEAIKDGFCSIHEKVEQRKDGKQRQCKKYKSDGTRCKMQTTSKSGFCYYHD